MAAGLALTHELALYYITLAYSVVVLTAYCIKEFPRKKMFVEKTLCKNKYAKMYINDVTIRTRLSLFSSLIMNGLFVAFNFVSAILYKSNWFGIFAIYYGLIGMLRFLLLHHMVTQKIGTNPMSELKRSRLCSYLLLTINVVLSGIVFMMAFLHNGFEYRGILIYGLSISTFTIAIVDLIDIIKYRNYHCPLISTSKAIRLTSALFSILFVETSLLAQLGWNLSGDLQSKIIIMSGLGISIAVVLMSVYIIIQTTKKLKHIIIEQKNQGS